ncbi:hypothetical protein ACFQ3K_14545 [Brucella gallinifaecis]|uniref:Uncharacterized protein n=1 Tax=Brucella gallinifaecis TaxID=215590 RepID=A0A502BR18_9HYPH|nr:hypothetical protein [Brucella gallinifaecis]TPF76685.1 hypothetical protein FHY56_04115 [Brucella gallinifaecis]
MEQASGGKRKSGRKALWAAVAVIAIAAAGAVGYKITLEKTISAQLEKRGGKAASVSADFFGRIKLTDVVLPLKEGTDITIGSIEGRPKILFLDGMLDATDIKTEVAQFRISLPSVRIDDANFDIGMLRDTFGNSALSLAERVGRFSAKRVLVPEINIVQMLNDKEQKTSYKDVILEDIVNGHVAQYTSTGASFDLDLTLPNETGGTKEERMAGTIGVSEGKDIDGVFIARLYTDAAGPDDKEAKPVYGPFSAKDIVIESAQAKFSYDEIRSNGFTMRLPAVPLTETLQKLEADNDIQALSPEERKEFFVRLISIFDTIGKGDVELLGMKVEPSDAEKGKGSIDKISMLFDNKSLDISLNGFMAGNSQDYVKLDEFSLKGFNWEPSVEAITKFAALNEEEMENFPFTTMLPEFGTTVIKGIEADVPYDNNVNDDIDIVDEDGNPAPKPDGLPHRLKIGVKSYEIALNKPVNGIPSDIRIAYEDMSLPVPADSNEEMYQQLRKLGFDRVTISSNVEANWDEPTQSLVIKDISMSGKDMGKVSMSGLMGGFTKEFFSGDKVLAQVALLGVKAREVKLTIENEGLAEKALQLYADEHNMSVDELRSTLLLVANGVLQELAAEQPQLQGVISAFNTFVAKPKSFEVRVTSKSERGIGALEMIAASQNPLLILDKVNIEATAD